MQDTGEPPHPVPAENVKTQTISEIHGIHKEWSNIATKTPNLEFLKS